MPDREEKIRLRAYSLWVQERCPAGRELDHWAQAERELNQEESVNKLLRGEPSIAAGPAPTGRASPKPESDQAGFGNPTPSKPR